MCHRKTKKLLDNFNHLKKASEEQETPKAPLGEFERIIEEMEKRGIEPKIRKELKKRRFAQDSD